MRILMLNWKDHRHSLAGGAETVTQEYLKHLVSFGHQAYLVSSHERSLPREEIIDGVHIIRHGSVFTVRLWAVYLYITKLRSKVDIVIDQIHGLPFFTPLYVNKPTVAFIHEVAGSIWFKEYNWLIAAFGSIWEKAYFSLYRKISFVTDTVSTKQELVTHGVKPSSIFVIPLTISKVKKRRATKSKFPSLIYIGRLSPMKRVDVLINSVKILTYSFPKLRTIISGTGKKTYVRKLQQQIKKWHLTNIIKLTGTISESRKFDLLRRAWIHVHPSTKEGFGLTVFEAASQNTPTVSFHVNGLKDIIQDGKTGALVKQQNAVALAAKLKKLLDNPQLCSKLGKNAFRAFQALPPWKKQAKLLEKLLVGSYSSIKQVR